MTPSRNQDEPIALADLSLFWRARARALRIVDAHRVTSDEATLEQARVYDKCAAEISAALAVPTSPPAGEAGWKRAKAAAPREG